MEIFTVYCLYSSRFNKIYIGFTSDLVKRFWSHNRWSNKGWTIKFRPWIVAYAEYFPEPHHAVKKEKQLKSAKGRQFLWDYIHKHYQ